LWFSCSALNDETRFHLDGVFFKSDGSKSRVVSTDGHPCVDGTLTAVGTGVAPCLARQVRDAGARPVGDLRVSDRVQEVHRRDVWRARLRLAVALHGAASVRQGRDAGAWQGIDQKMGHRW